LLIDREFGVWIGGDFGLVSGLGRFWFSVLIGEILVWCVDWGDFGFGVERGFVDGGRWGVAVVDGEE
jgi:hypothetical protein